MKKNSKIILLFSIFTIVASIEYDDLVGQMIMHDGGDRAYPQNNIPKNFLLLKRRPEMENPYQPITEESGNINPAFFQAKSTNKDIFVNVILLEKGDIDRLMENRACFRKMWSNHFAYNLCLSATVLGHRIAYFAYDARAPNINNYTLDINDHKNANLIGETVIDFINPARYKIDSVQNQIKQLRHFKFETCILLTDHTAEYRAYTARISTVNPIISKYTRRVIENELYVVLVLPTEFNLQPLNILSVSKQFYRIAKKAFVGGIKYWIVAIEPGDGNFSKLLNGLTNTYVAYAYFVGQNITTMANSNEEISHQINSKSFTLGKFIQKPRFTFCKYESTIELATKLKIDVFVKVIILSMNQEKAIEEIAKLKQNYLKKKNKNHNEFYWFCSNAMIINNVVAFFVYSDTRSKQIRLKVANKVSPIFATYLGFVGKILDPVNDTENSVQFKLSALRDYTQNPDAAWASYLAQISPPVNGDDTVRVTIQIIDPVKQYTNAALLKKYKKVCEENLGQYVYFSPKSKINKVEVSYFIQIIPTDIEKGIQIPNKIAYASGKYARFIGKTLIPTDDATILNQNGELDTIGPIVLRDLILSEEHVEWSVYLAKLNDYQDIRVIVQLIEPAKGYTIDKLKQEYKRRQTIHHKYFRFCTSATINNVNVAFLVFERKGEKAQFNQFILARYAGFVGKKLIPKRNVEIFDKNQKSVQFQISKLRYGAYPNTDWASFETKTSPSLGTKIQVIIQILNSTISFTGDKLRQLYDKMCQQNLDPHLRYCSHATINNENVAFLVHSLPAGNENVNILTDETSFLFAKYARLTGGTLAQTKGKVIIDEQGILAKMQPIVLRDFMLTNDIVKYALYYARISDDQEASVMVQLIEPSKGYTDIILRREYENRLELNQNQFLRFCPNATINNDVEVAFLVCDRYLIATGLTLIRTKYAGFVGEKIISESNVDIFDENGKSSNFSLSALIDNIEVFGATWNSFKARMILPSPLSKTRIEKTVRVLVQLLDPALNYTNDKLKDEYMTRRRLKPDHCLRFCSRATIINESVAFLVHSTDTHMEAGEVMVSHEINYLFGFYAHLVNHNVTNIINAIDRDQRIILLGSFTLTDYIQNSMATWGSFIAETNFESSSIQKGKFNIKLQILDSQKDFNADYLRFEYGERCKEEAKKIENTREADEDEEYETTSTSSTGPKKINKRRIFFCDQAEINGIPVAFLAYSLWNHGDKQRLKIYKPRVF